MRHIVAIIFNPSEVSFDYVDNLKFTDEFSLLLL
jgi:hypothetical protein